MFCNHNPSLESKNFVDGVDFTQNDPCVFTVYPTGAAGDLLISIIDKHYLRTGCEYYGISDNGRVMIYTTDYEIIDIEIKTTGQVKFDQQWFYDLADKLSERNLNYSLLDQVIFGCHLHKPPQIKQILDTFEQAKIINIYAKDSFARCVIDTLARYKLKNVTPSFTPVAPDYDNNYSPQLVQHDRVLNVPFGFLFDKQSYDKHYTIIRDFLGLPAPLISFDFIEFYLSKQHPVARLLLNQCGQTL